MKSKIKYIELKSGYNDDGPAWIGKVQFSKTGQTIYFNNKAFKGSGHGLCFDIETKLTYWISGLKKDGENRHWAGNGRIMIDKMIVDEFLRVKGFTNLDLNKYELVEIQETNKERFNAIENGSIETVSALDKYPDLQILSINELMEAVEYLKLKESRTNSNNGAKFIITKRLEAEKLLQQYI